ncbi:serine/threonine-protein kinase Nek10 isoform X2 [Electrophorus electricus]|uniref:serine/threonine-protein kinase Nek10 isoform X2 n=1 Tax=Electrophorus electricus TaxID=8005 RepID=UPI0015D002C1|nr:serine/threonine-protein kinase Nek10 isoform X2 [Electrophorus electricus]
MEFRMLAAGTQWNEPALVDAFVHGLKADLQAELACKPESSSMNEVVRLAITYDHLLQERRRQLHWGLRQRENDSLAVPGEKPTEPMQLGVAGTRGKLLNRRKGEQSDGIIQLPTAEINRTLKACVKSTEGMSQDEGKLDTFKMPPRNSQAGRQKAKEKELLDLRRLLSFVSAPISKQQVEALKPQKSRHGNEKKSMKYSSSEALELDNFSEKYREKRHFCGHPHHGFFLDIFTALIKNRLSCSEWMERSSPESILRVLICLRLLIREPRYQKVFYELHGLSHLVKYMESVTRYYLENGDQAMEREQLVTMTYMCQKLSTTEEQRKWMIECDAHKTLVKLLSAQDTNVLLGSLLALTTLADSTKAKEKIGELSIAENLLEILQEHETLSKRLSAELLRLLCPIPYVREQVRQSEGVPVLLSALHTDHLKLLWSTAWALVQLCQDPESSADICAWGGVQQLLHILQGERTYVSDGSSIETLSSANVAGRLHVQHLSGQISLPEAEENTVALHSAITELALDDTAAHHVVQENGVYIISKLILPHGSTTGQKAASLQCYAFRALRFLFSIKRNRHVFKSLFPPELFEMFIDVGHYVRDITAYEPLREKVSLLSTEELDGLREKIEAVNQNRTPLKIINGYSILHHLGSGAFGSVFKVRKQGVQNCLALKEVNLHNPAFGHDKKSRDSNVEKIVSELTIIKEQMAHPNIVKYLKTFIEGERLYIVMELVEGAPLADHFSSLKEKQQTFTEERVWNVFIQICLALRYLHKEKRIVHRDLTPGNIMLGERDKVTITDFGLAKQKEESSKLMSVVGTILYSCPEIVKSEPYGEKADVWAMGCVLYQMVALRPPFYSTNMLSLATKIVEAEFEPVEDDTFSERVTDMIKWCLTPNADLRPDVVQVSSRICDLIMRFLDGLSTSYNTLEKRAEREWRRAQKYCLENNRTKLTRTPSSMPRAFKDSLVIQDGLRTGRSDLHFSTESHTQDKESSHVSKAAGSAMSTVQTQANILSNLNSDSAKSPDSYSVFDEQTQAGGLLDFMKSKAQPAPAGICVSHRRVRQIDDPNLRLLGLLHKIIFITQLPPGPENTFQRRAVERFKKTLFQCGSSPSDLKIELNKVLQGSQEMVDLVSANRKWCSMVQSLSRHRAETSGELGYSSLQEGITYEQLQTMIEDVLEQSGCYRTPLSRSELEGRAGNSRSASP